MDNIQALTAFNVDITKKANNFCPSDRLNKQWLTVIVTVGVRKREKVPTVIPPKSGSIR